MCSQCHCIAKIVIALGFGSAAQLNRFVMFILGALACLMFHLLNKERQMANPFIKLIREGRIKTLDDLKSAYRRIVMKTHPDALGSNELVEKYLEYSKHYEEAKSYLLATDQLHTDNRLKFYQQLYNIDFLEEPYAYKPKNFKKLIDEANKTAEEAFLSWKKDEIEIYKQANEEYRKIKLKYMIEPYLKDGFKRTLRPVFHNLISYHLTGQDFYKRQINQNLNALLYRLDQEGYKNLKHYIEILIDDLNKGPAIFGRTRVM
jgi:curved DNA-binding protein CbpA